MKGCMERDAIDADEAFSRSMDECEWCGEPGDEDEQGPVLRTPEGNMHADCAVSIVTGALRTALENRTV